MSASTAEYPHIAHQVNELNLDKLLEQVTHLSSNYKPLVVFISATVWEEKIGSSLSYPFFTCQSIHDFLRIGLNLLPCVMVVDEDRAECSTHELKQLLSNRTEYPFELIDGSTVNENELVEKINDACRRIESIASIENTIAYPDKPVDRLGNTIELSRSSGFSKNKNLLRTKITEYIDQKPEEFLSEAISKIRNPQGD